MLIENIPADDIVNWASSFIGNSADRPWYYTDPPIVTIEYYQPPCRCTRAVKLEKYECVDGSFLYIGQCKYCETVIWSVK